LCTSSCYLSFIQDDCVISSTKEDIIESAKIYGKGTKRVLTSYEDAVNKEAGDICMENPMFLNKRDVLYEKAKERVRCDNSFVFKKGKSQSKSTE
jgi:hypothetical protein